MTTAAEWLAAHSDLDRFDRELLLCRGAAMSRARLLAYPDTKLSATLCRKLDAWATRRRAGEPVAYLLGSQGFRDFELAVSTDVLIPRPETELLVETALELIEPGQSVLDLGTGSGAIAIALARESRARVTAADLSPEALALAAANAMRLGAEVTWIESDWLTGIAERFDLIVSNPPYVAAGDAHLDALRFEPSLALVGGRDGLAALRTIIAAAPRHLAPGGWLLLEHGFDQGSDVRALLAAGGFSDIATRRDLADQERVSFGRIPRETCSSVGRVEVDP